jgi:hypothetical protein
MYLNIIFPPEGQRQPGRPRRRWDNNIKIDLNPYPANVENMVIS